MSALCHLCPVFFVLILSLQGSCARKFWFRSSGDTSQGKSTFCMSSLSRSAKTNRSFFLMNFCTLALCLFVTAVLLTSASALAIERDPRRVLEIQDPDYVLELLSHLGQSIVRANELENLIRTPPGSTKRGLDLGLGRGYSGTQAAKHLMGLVAASSAAGPGRRRRDTMSVASLR